MVPTTVWKPSEKCDGACTGKRAWVNPVIAPSKLGGVPPSSCARSSTEATYACEWLYEYTAPRISVSPPAVFKYLAAAKIASAGL
ncbi:MAG: hypothetical protein ACHQCH_06060 [Solirubrobacterales bacterium]